MLSSSQSVPLTHPSTPRARHQKEQKKELFKGLVGHLKRADCIEIAPKISKSPSQCYDAWRQTILPSILKVRCGAVEAATCFADNVVLRSHHRNSMKLEI